MKKYPLIFKVWICLLLSLITVYTVVTLGYIKNSNVYADQVTIPNDGTALDNPYGDSHLPKSYNGADYYDCYIPYQLRLSDIGGWANRFISGNPAYNATMSARTQGLYAGQKINREYDDLAVGTVARTGRYKGATVSRDGLNMNIYTDSLGNQYYGCALPEFCYKFGGLLTEGGSGFPGFSSANRGQLFDVILSDGTVIHFIVRDAKSSYHTNNDPSVRAPRNDEAVYGFTELLYPQYANLFQAQAGETLELFGSSISEFTSHYNINNSGAKVAIIRMYNANISNPPVRADGVGKEVSYKLADSVIISTPDGEHSMGSSALSLTGSTLVEEWELLGMPTYQELSRDQISISLPSLGDLSVADAANVISIGEYMSLMEQSNLLDNIRIGITAVGMIIVIYGILILLAVIFDRSNNFIDMSLIGILTLGKLKLNPEHEKGQPQPSGYASTMRMVGVGVLVIIIGFLILSSSLTMFIGRIVYRLI